MFIPANGGTVDYFTDLTEANTPQNRFNPRIYQRLWASAAPARLFDGGETTVGIDSEANLGNVEINEAEWSKVFNSLKYGYPAGNGFSLWVDNQELPETQKFTFRFPKEHTVYNYYSDYDGEMLSTSETLDRTDNGRFIYENDGTDGNQPLTFEYKGATRSVYTNVLPLTVSVKAETGTATKSFLVGNPFMSRIDIAAFIAGNDGVTAVKVYDGNTTISVNSELQTNATTVAKIEPMQSFFVEFDAEAAERDIVFTEEMLTGDAPATASEAPALRVVVYDGHKEAGTLLTGSDSGNSVESMVDAEAKPSLAVFAIADSKAYDILPLAGAETPLAVCAAAADTLTLRFDAENGFDKSHYALLDNRTGITYSLDETISIGNGEASVGRYSIVDTDLLDDKADDNKVFVTVDGGVATVMASGGGIVGVAVYGMDGRMDTSVKTSPVFEKRVELQRDLQIVSVTLADGTVHNFKIVAYL